MSQQKFLLVEMASIGGFSSSLSDFSGAFDGESAAKSSHLFPMSYMESKFMNFVDNLIHHELKGQSFVLSGENAMEDDESYFDRDESDETLYYAAHMHPIISGRDASPSNQERFTRLFQPNVVRYYYTPVRNEFFDKWDIEAGVNGHRIHPLPILISSCITHYDSDLTYGDMYHFKEHAGADYIGAWANEPLIALDDSLASMLFLSVKRAKRIELGYKHEDPEAPHLEDLF